MEEKVYIYISGKVTGLPLQEVEDKFREAAGIVRHHGAEPVVPIYYCCAGWSWHECMKTCLALLLSCDKIMLLPDWKKSRGAKIEFLVALAAGIPILKYKPHAAD